MDKIAGIILAGGQSSRMGRNKALLDFRGLPMVEHMRKILAEAGLRDTYISGAVEGHETIPDAEPFSGPGRAIAHLLQKFSARYERLLFIPVDMPFINTDVIRGLVAEAGNVFIKNHPLPNCLLTGNSMLSASSVQGLLEEVSAQAIDLPGISEKDFLNLNTPEEWEKATGAPTA